MNDWEIFETVMKINEIEDSPDEEFFKAIIIDTIYLVRREDNKSPEMEFRIKNKLDSKST